MRDISVAFEKIKEAISRAQDKHKRVADKHRRSLDFKEDDWVLLKFSKARLSHTTGKNRQGRTYRPSKVLYEACKAVLWAIPDSTKDQ